MGLEKFQPLHRRGTDMIIKHIAKCRIFTPAAWAAGLDKLTFKDWQKAGGGGTSALTMEDLKANFRTSWQVITTMPLAVICKAGRGGRCFERNLAGFAHRNPLAVKLSDVMLESTWEWDQETGELLHPWEETTKSVL